MDPNVWGNHAWIFLHSVTMNYPDNPSIYDRENYYNFFNSLIYVLPCGICKDNYKSNLHKYPLLQYLDSKKTLVKWFVKIHNEVNLELGKSEMQYEKVIEKYKKMYETCENKTFGGSSSVCVDITAFFKRYPYIILCGIAICCYVVYKKRKIE
tara:strand:+ start:234 stop:692 length:459 start_codon:yes stop_codon:yes gene_type:complete